MKDLAAQLLDIAKRRNIIIATAESCTGGMVSSAITSVAGSSDVFDRAFVTYSNEAKNEMIGVGHDLLTEYGAVSKEVAEAMVEGCTNNSNANLAIAITGIAGPGGGSEEKPVGLVYIAVMFEEKIHVAKNLLEGTREQIRVQSSEIALKMMIDALS